MHPYKEHVALEMSSDRATYVELKKGGILGRDKISTSIKAIQKAGVTVFMQKFIVFVTDESLREAVLFVMWRANKAFSRQEMEQQLGRGTCPHVPVIGYRLPALIV